MKFRLRKYLNFRSLIRGFLATAVVASLGVALYTLYLDGKVREQFEGRRFALPARVYARPLELFAGARLSADEFAKELQRLGYKQPLQGSEPGYFLRHDNAFEVVTRPFIFWDGAQPAAALRLTFGDSGLESLTDAAGTPVDLARLDPEYIGGIYPAHNEDRVLVKLDEVPSDLINALIAVEDRRFYSHAGVDPRGLARAVVTTLSGGERQGGSTLTQQLVKNFFLTPERTLKRKFNEALMALLLEYRYDKHEILETYINEIYLGQDKNRAIHGFGLAAQFYFGKPLHELSLAQSALLVGIVKGPKLYDPHKRPAQVKERRNLALSLMRDQQFITEQQFLQAKIEPLGIIDKPAMGTTRYPAFFDLVRKQLLRDYQEADLREQGLQIFTTLDPRTQAAAEHALATRLAQLDKKPAKDGALLEGAVVVTDSQNGEVQALVGGRDPSYPGFNRAIDSRRSIGSLMKPAVYLAALADPQRRYTLITPLDDSPLTWNEPGRPAWSPKNYDKGHHGNVPLRSALANSYNIPTARLGIDLGVDKVLEMASRLGTGEPIPPFASSVLGAVPMSPLDVTQMYQTIASGGFRVPLRAIREVLTADGTPLQRYQLSVEQVADAEAIYLLTTALQGVVREGTAKGLVNFVPAEINVAGKTGTTDDARDAWFAGFTGDRVAVVWIGYDDNRPTRYTGGGGALPIWGQLMAQLDPEPLMLPLPDTIEMVWIDAATGLRGDLACPEAVELPFIKDTAPTEVSPCVATVLPAGW